MRDAIVFMTGIGFGTVVTCVILIVALISDEIRREKHK